ncbi:MAG: M20/M25/M40 family metallo-hydrolase, partial [Chloroflexota bacterium]
MLEHFRGKKWDVIVRQLMLIEHQTYTPSKEDVDEIVEYITDQVNPLKPSSIEQMPQENIGDMLLFKWHENAPGKPIMVLMHMDTVHPLHKIGEDMPFGIDDDTERIMGPGAISMKGGICAAITAVEGLIER